MATSAVPHVNVYSPDALPNKKISQEARELLAQLQRIKECMNKQVTPPGSQHSISPGTTKPFAPTPQKPRSTRRTRSWSCWTRRHSRSPRSRRSKCTSRTHVRALASSSNTAIHEQSEEEIESPSEKRIPGFHRGYHSHNFERRESVNLYRPSNELSVELE